MASVIQLFAVSPARAAHVQPDDEVANDGPAGTNDASPYWEDYLAAERGIDNASCTKINQAADAAWVMPAAPAGEDWVLLVVKQGTTNFVYYDPVAGHTYPSVGDNAPGYSHIIVCSATTPPPPSGWACVGGEVVFIEDATEFEGTLYDTQGEALEDPACQEVAASTTFTIGGDCALGEAGAAFTISGNLGEGLTLTVAGQTVDSTGAFSIAVGGAGSYGYEVSLDDGFVLAEGSPSSEGAIVIGDCTPPPPPSGWVCEAGEAVFLADTTGFEGTVYDSQAEALEDPDCQDVMAATTFTIGGTCALVGDEASFTISGSLGEGLTLTVAGQTITTSPFSVDVSAAGSYPYSVTLDEGFELAVGSPAASGTILIQDCTSDDEVDDVDELPFTGIDPGALALASMALLGTGTMMLRSSRKLEES